MRTQPAITLQVQALERELGVQLFDRVGGKKIRLTENGAILLDLVAPLMDGFDTLKERFDEARGQARTGTVRIATHTSVMTNLLPAAVKTFKKKYPEWNVSILNRSREDIVKAVMSGEVDMGITSLKSVPRSVDYEVFARFRRLVVAPKGHPLGRKKETGPRDIARYPLILPPKGTNTREIIDRVFGQEGISYTVAVEATGRMAAREYVGQGLGVSILNEFYLSKDDMKRYLVRDVSNTFGTAERGILTRKKRYLPAPVREFIGMLTGHVKDMEVDRT